MLDVRRFAHALLLAVLYGCAGDASPSAEKEESEPSSEDETSDADGDGENAEASTDAAGDPADAASAAGERPPVRDAESAADDAGAEPADVEVGEDAPFEPSSDAGALADAAAKGDDDAGDGVQPDAGAPPVTSAYHIALRVHRADSGLSGAELALALEEVNAIWWQQAAICFEIEIVRTEEVRRDGFDLWFHRSRLGCGATGNGVYCGDHDMHTLDAPRLNRADSREWDTRIDAARTSAHELGHGLSLDHYNGYRDSNDSLMSSGRQGFKLHESEITAARRRARSKALADAPATPCSPVPIVD